MFDKFGHWAMMGQQGIAGGGRRNVKAVLREGKFFERKERKKLSSVSCSIAEAGVSINVCSCSISNVYVCTL
jgi:hypothetical protein